MTAGFRILEEDSVLIAHICSRLLCIAMIAKKLHRFPWEHLQSERNMGNDVLSNQRRQPEANAEKMKQIRGNSMRHSDALNSLCEQETAVASWSQRAQENK